MPEHFKGIPESYEEKMRGALVTALFQLDPHKTFHLDTTPEEEILFKVCLYGDLASLKQLLKDASLLALALTEKFRPYA